MAKKKKNGRKPQKSRIHETKASELSLDQSDKKKRKISILYVIIISGATLIVVMFVLFYNNYQHSLDNQVNPINSENNTPGQPDISPGGAINTIKVDTTDSDVKPSLIGNAKTQITKNRIEKFGNWFATDYQKGDLISGNYEVNLGDTLWEISEAVYGNGSHWVKIRDANWSRIGTLADGSRALIVPGQILFLP